MFGGKPRATLVVTDIEKETGLTSRSRVYLGEKGEKLAGIIAERVPSEVEKILSESDRE